MKIMNQNLSNVVLCLFEASVGILLLINPVGFTSGIIITAGIVLMAVGIVMVVKYFKASALEAAVSQLLAKGLLALLGGVFCALKSRWFIVTFPVLTIVYGIVILITGLYKIQKVIDGIRLKSKKWFVGALSAVISIACAIIILNNPFASAVILWKFTGISLIVEAVFDIVALILSNSNSGEKS